MLTVVCWKWRGWQPVYGPEHVNALARMLRRHLGLPYRLVCVTDDAEGVTECETWPLWEFPAVRQARERNCFPRLKLFDPDTARALAGDGWLLSVDLDCVILGELAPLITQDDFRALRGHVSPLNGSLWLLRAGAHPEVWTRFDPSESPRLCERARSGGRPIIGSDQAWMSLQLPRAPTWGREDGVLQYAYEPRPMGWRPPEGTRAVFFPGRVKPWSGQLKAEAPWLHAEYQRYLTEAS